MAITACPHCHKSIELKAVGVSPTSDNSLGRAELRAVQNFLSDQTPGRRMYTAEVFENYQLFRREIEKGSPELTKNALARALREFGAIPWRDAAGRGWIMPEVHRQDATPKPARSVLEAEDEAAYREMVAQGGPAHVDPDSPEGRIARGLAPF